MSVLALAAPSRSRLIAVRLLAVVYAAFVGLASFGLPSLLTSWFATGDELPLRTAYVVWGVLAGLLVPALALALLRRTPVATCQALLGLVCACTLALALGFNPDHFPYFAGVAGPAMLLLALHPQNRAALRLPTAVDPFAALVVAAMAVPAAAYGIDMALTSRATKVLHAPSGQFTLHGQYAQAAVLAFSLLLIAAVGTIRQPGRRLLVALVAASAGILGVAGILFPHDALSLGTAWGAITLVAAGLYALAAFRHAEYTEL